MRGSAASTTAAARSPQRFWWATVAIEWTVASNALSLNHSTRAPDHGVLQATQPVIHLESAVPRHKQDMTLTTLIRVSHLN